MVFDFRNVSVPKSNPKPTDPIELFQTLRGKDNKINDLWMAQSDALRDWHKNRQSSDTALVLNTGAGKTLVGLLIAQSITNETHGQVVYACSSIQLVKQTERLAAGYGIPVSTYIQRVFSNDLYHGGNAPCITTYQALFNGLSRFMSDEISSVVFDDSHTVGNILREQFTLTITQSSKPALYESLVTVFQPYFDEIGQRSSFEEVTSGSDPISRFIPPFAVRDQLNLIRTYLEQSDLHIPVETKFSWKHLRDHLDLCAFFVSSKGVSVTPPLVPIDELPYFHKDVRRIYLSATLGSKDDFVRTFGRSPSLTIEPKSTAGECERLILVPEYMKAKEEIGDDIEITKHAVKDQKALVIVPTYNRAESWANVSIAIGGEFHEKLDTFAKSSEASVLVVAARYDGMDLAGDKCRVLVIDDLPSSMNPLERFLWERLNLRKVFRSTVSARVVQSFGRITRGMNDYGVVIVTGKRLVEWLANPKNLATLPEFIQRQYRLGCAVSEEVTASNASEIMKLCLERDADWTEYYANTLHQFPALDKSDKNEIEELLGISVAESRFRKKFWKRDYLEAASELERNIETTLEISTAAGAWHLLWIGYCYELAGQGETATAFYSRSHRTNDAIPPPTVYNSESSNAVSSQIASVADSLTRGIQGDLALPRQFDSQLQALDGGQSSRATEKSIEVLGTFLGLSAERPDNEFSSGPDVLWKVPDGTYIIYEAKTDKDNTSVYTKSEIGQLRDHRQWVIDNRASTRMVALFVGPNLKASDESNPDQEILVVQLGDLRTLRGQLKDALLDIVATASPATVKERTRQVFDQRGLAWPDVFDNLHKPSLVSIGRG